jgi:putative iron-dependent peroxidase
VSESGLFFIAYTKTLDTPEKMLSRMMGTTGDGLHDHLMDYTRAVSGATFFAPSLEVLKSLGARSGR